MVINSNVLGIAALLLILAAQGEKGDGIRRTDAGAKTALLPLLEVGEVLNDFHKLTFIMNHMDNLGQMAIHPSERPKLPPPSELITKAIPDFSNIVETLAPFLSAFSGEGIDFGDSRHENKNDIF